MTPEFYVFNNDDGGVDICVHRGPDELLPIRIEVRNDNESITQLDISLEEARGLVAFLAAEIAAEEADRAGGESEEDMA